MPLKKKREKRPVYSDVRKNYLLTGEWNLPDANEDEQWDVFAFSGDGAAIRAAWEDLREELLADWLWQRPGTRPWPWWDFDAPEPLRLRVGGKGDLIPAYDNPRNLNLGIPRKDDFIKGYLSSYTAKYGRQFDLYDPADPPAFESEASYLRRFGLLSPGEEKRVPAEAWGPEVVR